MSAIRNDKKFASPVKKEGKAIGAELGEEELKQVVGGSFSGELSGHIRDRRRTVNLGPAAPALATVCFRPLSCDGRHEKSDWVPSVNRFTVALRAVS